MDRLYALYRDIMHGEDGLKAAMQLEEEAVDCAIAEHFGLPRENKKRGVPTSYMSWYEQRMQLDAALKAFKEKITKAFEKALLDGGSEGLQKLDEAIYQKSGQIEYEHSDEDSDSDDEDSDSDEDD